MSDIIEIITMLLIFLAVVLIVRFVLTKLFHRK